MKMLLSLVKLIAIVYCVVCVVLYFMQERLLFFPEKLTPTHQFTFAANFEEMTITAKDSVRLNGLLFRADSSQGLIFYLHGNAGSLASWGDVASVFTALHYDVFMLDYRGYGKSEGKISSEQQLHADVQLAYDSLTARYGEKNIIVAGYSIGTGPATRLAAFNHPALLLLHAPYYSLTDLARHRFPFIPSFLLRYHLPLYKWLPACKMPVFIFHGDKDEVIYYGSSLKLQKLFKPSDKLMTLPEQQHNGIHDNATYLAALKKLLE